MLRAVQEMDVPNGDPMAVVCSHVLAPALGAFTHWLLEQAKENGVRRLYFLARDGYFFYHGSPDLLRSLPAAHGMPVSELFPVFASVAAVPSGPGGGARCGLPRRDVDNP